MYSKESIKSNQNSNSNSNQNSNYIIMVTLSKEQEQKQQKQKPKPKSEEQKEWIRGVNIGGWLMAERFITPYLFAINTCHLEGSLCWYPGQIGAPPNSTDTDNNDLFCDTTSKCQPVLAIKAKPPTDIISYIHKIVLVIIKV